MTRAEPGPEAVTAPATGWDYGDYPYGLEPLFLPDPDAVARVDQARRSEVEEAYRHLVAAVRGEVLTTEPAAEHNVERIFWYRWITGHHISFVIWRRLAMELRMATQRAGRQVVGPAMADCVRAYCGMLLYTGSCTSSIYNDSIRPSMYRLHHAFSGTWSADYGAVRALLSGRLAYTLSGPEVRRLVREVELSKKIHLGVAAKLVADGRSLLQALPEKTKVAQRRLRNAIFDCCFLTTRAPVSAEEVSVQWLRRTRAVAIDLRTNGMYPRADGTAEEGVPEELADRDVIDCEADLLVIMARAAAVAADLPPGELDQAG